MEPTKPKRKPGRPRKAPQPQPQPQPQPETPPQLPQLQLETQHQKTRADAPGSPLETPQITVLPRSRMERIAEAWPGVFGPWSDSIRSQTASYELVKECLLELADSKQLPRNALCWSGLAGTAISGVLGWWRKRKGLSNGR